MLVVRVPDDVSDDTKGSGKQKVCVTLQDKRSLEMSPVKDVSACGGMTPGYSIGELVCSIGMRCRVCDAITHSTGSIKSSLGTEFASLKHCLILQIFVIFIESKLSQSWHAYYHECTHGPQDKGSGTLYRVELDANLNSEVGGGPQCIGDA